MALRKLRPPRLSSGIVFRAVIHARVWFSLCSLMSASACRAFFLGRGLFDAKRDIRQFQKTAAVGRAARTVFPGAFASRSLQAVTRCYPKVFGDLCLFIRFLGHVVH